MARRRAPTPPTFSDECCYEAESTEEGSFAGPSPSSSHASSHTPRTGIGAYDFDDEALGYGGSATVHLAQPKAGGSRCVVKALRKEGPSTRRLAQNEAAMMRLLEHPGICKLLDTFEDDDNFYLVLEYIDGHELFDEVAAQTPMGECRTAEVMRQLLAALQHCHNCGVIHRDLKPENVMVAGQRGSGEPEVKLVDFGLAMREGQQVDGVAGTRPYLAPEALAGRGTCGAALDLWSAGVILYTCLLGELPPSSVRSGALPVLEAEAWHQVQVSAAAKDLVARLMRPEARERLTAAEAVRHPWLHGGTSVLPAAKPCAKASTGLSAQGCATTKAGKEQPREQLPCGAAAAAPTEHADELLSRGTRHVVVGEWLDRQDVAASEVGKEAGLAPVFGPASLAAVRRAGG